MAMNRPFKFEIVQYIAVLSAEKKGWTKELNLVAYNDDSPKYDIRAWDQNHEKMGKGITFTKEELTVLYSVLKELL